jgi:hypothetical protein
MIRDFAIVREAASRVAKAAQHATEALREGRVEQEPAFTDRMLGGIEEAMREFRTKGVTWTAKTLTDRAPGAQERQYGADFAGVLSISLPGFSVRKGFLAQAKRIEPGKTMRNDEFDRMKGQCERMLSLTPDAFVFLYAVSGIAIVPALSVLSSERRNPHEFYSRSIARFYEEHFESFIGDRRLHVPTAAVLENLRHDLDVRRLLYLEARA